MENGAYVPIYLVNQHTCVAGLRSLFREAGVDGRGARAGSSTVCLEATGHAACGEQAKAQAGVHGCASWPRLVGPVLS